MRLWIASGVLAALVSFSAPAKAWWPAGHSIIAEAAVESLPDEVPQWFRDGDKAIAHFAQDPDIEKVRDLALMNEREFPLHFFDLELLKGRPIPRTRAEFLRLTRELNVDASEVGELPYSLGEMTQRLTTAFAETRRYPNNPYARQKALFYAGILSHYAADSAMPLHTTVHYDGRLKADGKSPHSGIHAKIDSLVEKLEFAPSELRVENVTALPELFPGILNQIAESHAQVDGAYAMEGLLPPGENTPNWQPSPQLREWTRDRARNGAHFTAQLFLTAWRDSEKVKLPAWLERENPTTQAQP